MSAPGEFWMRWRVRAGYPLALAYFLLVTPTPMLMAAGAAVGAIGLAIRAAAAGHLRKHQQLSTSGPYAWTRNPLYFGSVLLAAGMMVAGGSWIAAALVAAYIVLFYPPVMRREESELRARYGAEYDAYAARVPLSFPMPPRRAEPGEFSWAQYRRNREYQALLGFVLALAALWARMTWPLPWPLW